MKVSLVVRPFAAIVLLFGVLGCSDVFGPTAPLEVRVNKRSFEFGERVEFTMVNRSDRRITVDSCGDLPLIAIDHKQGPLRWTEVERLSGICIAVLMQIIVLEPGGEAQFSFPMAHEGTLRTRILRGEQTLGMSDEYVVKEGSTLR